MTLSHAEALELSSALKRYHATTGTSLGMLPVLALLEQIIDRRTSPTAEEMERGFTLSQEATTVNDALLQGTCLSCGASELLLDGICAWCADATPDPAEMAAYESDEDEYDQRQAALIDALPRPEAHR